MVQDVDLRPTINYKMIEPMQNIDPAVIMNKRIDKLNKDKQKKFFQDMK